MVVLVGWLMPVSKAIQYLSADYQPTHMQSEAGITQLTQSLAAYDLTKAEKLQIVNLAPTEPVELYVVRSVIIRTGEGLLDRPNETV